jgi:hypothetical protein
MCTGVIRLPVYPVDAQSKQACEGNMYVHVCVKMHTWLDAASTSACPHAEESVGVSYLDISSQACQKDVDGHVKVT